MYGYFTDFGYRVCVNGRWILFATEADYWEYEEET